MDLQLFGEKTEQPTPKRLQKAREDGKTVRSNDLVAGFGLLAFTFAMQGLGATMGQNLWIGMADTFSHLSGAELTPTSIGDLLQNWSLLFLRTILPVAGIMLVIGLLLGTLQTRFIFTLKPLVPKFETLNPLNGLKRIFSLRTVTELIKGILKLVAVGWIAYSRVLSLVPRFPNLMEQSVTAGVVAMVEMAVGTLQAIGFALLVIGILDYGYQYWEYWRSLKMSKDEVKREHKEQEGSPELKSKQRQRAREMALRRKALKDVPLADVVITNPTHYAIALKYDPKAGSAPKVTAKGADLLAQRIKTIARENKVPTVENRTLARGLYAAVEVGKLVPPEYYQAVAEVLAFVYNLRRQQRQDQS